MLKKFYPLTTSLLFFLIASSWALMIKSNLLSENPQNIIFILYLYIYLFIIAQTLIIFIFLKSANLLNYKKFLLVGILFVFNFYALVLSISSEFTILQYPNKIKNLIMASIIILFITLLFISNLKILKILCFFYLFSNLFYFFNIYEKVLFFVNKNNIEINTFAKTNFKIKKNIYIYSFESLMPGSLVKKHFNIQNVDYMEVLEKEKLTIPKNNFADNITTLESLNSSLYINPVKWRKLEDSFSKSFFAGRVNSPLFTLLKNNGYKISTGFYDTHFGPPGKYVDRYFTFRSINSDKKTFLKYYPNFCQYKMPWYHFKVFGYCETIAFLFNIKEEDKEFTLVSFNNYVINQIGVKDVPNFSWYHIYSQTHPNHNMKDFVKIYKNKLPETAKFIKNIIKNIKQKDPNSILIIFGDHGVIINDFSTEEDLKQSIKNQYNDLDKFKIIDAYATQSAVLDYSNLCPKAIQNLSNNEFTTNTMIVNEFLLCFIDSNKILNDKIIYNLPDKKEFKDYLYE